MGAQKITSTIAPHTAVDALQAYSQRQLTGADRSVYSEAALILSKLRAYFDNYVVHGLVASAATTGPTQATGATGATVLNVNLEAGVVVVNGQAKEFAAQADYSLWASTIYTGDDAGTGTTKLTDTNKAIVTVVAASSSATRGSGTISLVVCHGATHATAPVCCTDAEIQTKVGAGLPWVRICDVQINRTADTTATQSQVSTLRPLLGVTTDADFWGTVQA
jgi:hypothetical protein